MVGNLVLCSLAASGTLGNSRHSESFPEQCCISQENFNTVHNECVELISLKPSRDESKQA